MTSAETDRQAGRDKTHWYNNTSRSAETGEITSPPRDARTRCNIPLYRKKAIGRSHVRVEPRPYFGGDPIRIPEFLSMPNRCRICGRLLRTDTGLLAGAPD